MSRCFPFPPPNYRKEDKSLADSIKLHKEQEEAKERKKEKKRLKKERKERRDKSKEDHVSGSKHKEHSHKKRKYEERNELLVKDDFRKEAAAKDIIEQLEKSGLTEEHGLSRAIQEPSESSESTQNSFKSRKVEAAPGVRDHGSTILRLRLPLQKHNDPKPGSTSHNDGPSLSGLVASKDLKATPAAEEACFSGRITSRYLEGAPASEGPCLAGRTTSKNLKVTPASGLLDQATSKDVRVTLANEAPCFSGRVTSEAPKTSLASEGSCFSGRPAFEALKSTPSSKATRVSGRVTSNDLKATPASERPCFLGQATHKDSKVASVIEGACLSGRAATKALSATLSSEGPCISGRGVFKDLDAIPANEAPLCFSGCATEVRLRQRSCDNAPSQPIESNKRHVVTMERQLGDNDHSLSVGNCKSTEAPVEQKFDENAHIHSSSISRKGSKRARKLEQKFRDLIVNWKPEPLLLDAKPGTEDLSWLIGSSSAQHCVDPDATSHSISSVVEKPCYGSAICSFQPKARYLPEFESYQLPYVVPF